VNIWQVVIVRITVVQFRMDSRGGKGTGSLKSCVITVVVLLKCNYSVTHVSRGNSVFNLLHSWQQ